MKNINRIYVILLLVFGFSCSEVQVKDTGEDGDFEFVIQGNVKNGEGQSIALVIPSKYPDDTFIEEITDGSFLFKGVLNAEERAGLSIANTNTYQWPRDIFISKDTISLDLEIGEMNNQIILVKDSLIGGELNRHARSTKKKYYDIDGMIVYRDSAKRDSMRKNVYPLVRKKTLELIEKELGEKRYSVIALFYLKQALEDKDFFNQRDLTDREKEQFFDLYNNIDSTLRNTPDYKVVKSYISNIKSDSNLLKFKDFTLIGLDDEKVTLSNIIAQNNYTVIDFWWSGCRPCRKFNKESKSYYKKLKEEGIEIVSVNVDQQKDLWRSSSSQDKIEWVNLYAGNNSTVIPDYRVTYYPTKVIFNKSKEVIDFDFNTAIELLSISDRQEK